MNITVGLSVDGHPLYAVNASVRQAERIYHEIMDPINKLRKIEGYLANHINRPSKLDELRKKDPESERTMEE